MSRHDRNAVTLRADVLHLFLTRTEKLSRAAMTESDPESAYPASESGYAYISQ